MYIRKILLLSLALVALLSTANAQIQIEPTPKFDNDAKTKIAKSFEDRQQVKKDITVSTFIDKPTAGFQTSAMSNAVRRTKENEDVIWWSYPGVNNKLNPLKLKNSFNYNVAMVVPKSLAGTKVDALSVGFEKQTDLASDITFFFAPIVKNAQGKLSPGSYTKTYKLSKSKVKDITEQGLDTTALDLPEAYQIPDDGCFVGMSFTASESAQNPILLYYGQEADGGCYIKLSDGKWHSLYGNNYGNLNIGLHTDVTGHVSADVAADNIFETPLMVGGDGRFSMKITNNGFRPVSQFSYVMTVDNQAMPEQTYNFEEASLPSTVSAYLYIPYSPITDGEKNVSMKITKVDGVENISDEAEYSKGTVLALAEQAERTSVVEETTGVWSGWCPKGHVGMRRLNEDLGNGVITLSSHVGVDSDDDDNADAMTTANASTGEGDYFLFQYMRAGGKMATAMFDRTIVADSYLGLGTNSTETAMHYGATDVVKAVKQSIPSEADLKLSASWTDGAHSAINANVTTTFKVNRKTYPYGLVFVLSEDGMKDPNPTTTSVHYKWAQYNFFSPEYRQIYQQYFKSDFTGALPYADDDLKEYREGHYLVADQVYDHVIVGAWGPDVRLSSYLTAKDVVNGFGDPFANLTAAKDKQIYWNKELSLSGATSKLVQDYDKLQLTAILVNKNNGQIVNAARVALSGNSSINGITSKTDQHVYEVARYNVNGQMLKTPQKGLNIIKMSDGKSMKVFLK